jgi:NitT/TauT family transport system substrate-binding protein
LFTSKDMPGLVPDLLVAQEKSIKSNRKDYLGMIKAWYDAEKFIRENTKEAAEIMAKVVSMKPDEYKVFLPGTRFFAQKDNLEAFGPSSDPKSLLGVGPTIEKFLSENKLIEGKVDFAKGLDPSLVKEVAAK